MVAPAAHALSSLLPLSWGVGHTGKENNEVHSCDCGRFRVTEDSPRDLGEQGRGKRSGGPYGKKLACLRDGIFTPEAMEVR